MSLDANNPDPAYRLGRLLAVLEAIQSQARGMANQSGVNRLYSAASRRPGSIFPKIIQLAQHHLEKLPSASREFRQNQLGEVINEIIDFSPMQTIEEQGRFGLGYYHQRQANFQKAVLDEVAHTNVHGTRKEEGVRP